jgi:hypothetical protein
MELERDDLVSPIQEVPVIEGELAARFASWRVMGSKKIARTVSVARNTVGRYLRAPIAPGVQVRPAARRLTDDARDETRTLDKGSASGNAIVVQRLLKSARRTWACGRSSVQSPTFAARAAPPSTRRCAFESAPSSSCGSISVRSVCASRASACASSCWSPSTATPAGCSSSLFSVSGRMIGARASGQPSRTSAGCADGPRRYARAFPNSSE